MDLESAKVKKTTSPPLLVWPPITGASLLFLLSFV
jgi:hypothetical protein